MFSMSVVAISTANNRLETDGFAARSGVNVRRLEKHWMRRRDHGEASRSLQLGAGR